MRVVERLEAVEVDEDEAEGRAVGLGQAELVGQGRLELAPVGQPGEVVGHRELLDVVEQPGVAQREGGVRRELLEGGDDAALHAVAGGASEHADQHAGGQPIGEQREDGDTGRVREPLRQQRIPFGVDLAQRAGSGGASTTRRSQSRSRSRRICPAARRPCRSRRGSSPCPPGGTSRRSSTGPRCAVARWARTSARSPAWRAWSSAMAKSWSASTSERRRRSSRSLTALKVAVPAPIRSTDMPKARVRLASPNSVATDLLEGEEEDQVPGRHLQAGAVGHEQDDRDEVQGDERAQDARLAAGGVGDEGQVDAVDEEHRREQVPVAAGPEPHQVGRRLRGEVEGGGDGDRRERRGHDRLQGDAREHGERRQQHPDESEPLHACHQRARARSSPRWVGAVVASGSGGRRRSIELHVLGLGADGRRGELGVTPVDPVLHRRRRR